MQNRTFNSGDFKVISTPAYFWERGTHCLVVKLCMLERLDEAAAFFGEAEWYRRHIYAIRIALNHFSSIRLV